MSLVEVSTSGKINGKLALLFDEGVAKDIDSQKLAKVASILNCEIVRDSRTGLLKMKAKFTPPKVALLSEKRQEKKARKVIPCYSMPDHEGPGAA